MPVTTNTYPIHTTHISQKLFFCEAGTLVWVNSLSFKFLSFPAFVMAMHTISIGKEIKKEVCSIKTAPANSLGIVLKHSYVTASLHLYQIMIV